MIIGETIKIETEADLARQKAEEAKTVHRVISVFGAQNQKMQTIEELMELQKELIENVHRGTDNRAAIVEEVADVEVMMKQMRVIFGIDEKEIASVKANKMQRLNHTIEKYLAKQKNSATPVAKQEVHIDRDTSNGR